LDKQELPGCCSTPDAHHGGIAAMRTHHWNNRLADRQR
jgi:hypothetical protein